jgi:hypothetical protein
MSLSYLREDCHEQAVTHIRESRRFESMYTLQGKLDQHDTYASHTSPRTPGVRFLRAVPIRGNLPRAADRVGRSHCSREKGLSTQSPAHRLTDPRVRTQFLSRANQWSSGENQTSINSRLLGLPGIYHRHVIGTFNTCSGGPIERSLIDTGGGYNLEGAGLPYTHSPTFPTSCLPFPLVAPPGLHFNQVPAINQSLRFKEPMAATWSFDHSAIYRSLHLRLASANNLSLVEGSQE